MVRSSADDQDAKMPQMTNFHTKSCCTLVNTLVGNSAVRWWVTGAYAGSVAIPRRAKGTTITPDICLPSNSNSAVRPVAGRRFRMDPRTPFP